MGNVETVSLPWVVMYTLLKVRVYGKTEPKIWAWAQIDLGRIKRSECREFRCCNFNERSGLRLPTVQEFGQFPTWQRSKKLKV